MQPSQPQRIFGPKPAGACAFVHAGLLLLFLSFQLGCTSPDSSQAILTFSPSRSTFTVIVSAEGMLEARKSHVLNTPPRIYPQPTISYLVPEGSAVKKDDVVAKFEAKKIQQDYLTALDKLELARAEAEAKEAELALQRLLLESQMKSADAAGKISRLQLARLEFAAPKAREIVRLEMARSELEAGKARSKLKFLKAIQKEERAHRQMVIKQAENRVNRAKMMLDRLVLKAPVDGIVIYEKSWMTGKKVQEGDAAYSGMPVVKIPDLSAMQVKLQIGEVEAQKLKKDQRATVVVPVLGDVRFPGKVTQVARMAKPAKRGSKVKKVETVVEIEGAHAALVSGLTARADIVVKETPDALVVPLECLFEKDSLNVVYIRQSGRFMPREVTISEQNADFAVVESGLQGSERLALRQPADALIK